MTQAAKDKAFKANEWKFRQAVKAAAVFQAAAFRCAQAGDDAAADEWAEMAWQKNQEANRFA